MPALLSTSPTGREQFLKDLHGPSSSSSEATTKTSAPGSSSSSTSMEEEVPVKRAVRMVIGLSESSLNDTTNTNSNTGNSADTTDQQQQIGSDNATPQLAMPRKNRQESDGTTSTVPSVLSSMESLTMNESTSTDLHVEEDRRIDSSNSAKAAEEAIAVVGGDHHHHPRLEEDDDYDDETSWSGSGIHSVAKLYGRTKEQDKLHELYTYIVDHGKYNQQQQQEESPDRHPMREFVLVSGSVGTGKTSLAETLRKKVMVDDGGYFCVGAFDSMMQRGPMAPMVDAFAQFVSQVFDKGDEEVAIIQKRIRCMIGPDDISTLEGFLPSLTDLLAVETKNVAHCGACSEFVDQTIKTRTDNRAYTHQTMTRLMRAISRPERPVCLVLDDLQWAGGCAFEFLGPMAMDDMNDGFMYLGTTRDDVSPSSEVSKFLRHIEDGGVHITNISLGHLGLDSVEEMVNDSFLMPPEKLNSLAKFIHLNSNGNPLFLTMSMQTMQREPRLVHYDKETDVWSMNKEVADQYVSQCPIHLITKKLETYPREQQKVMSVASCLGSHATQTMIEAALQEDVDESLQTLVAKRKLVFDEKEKTYSICHNAIQEAAQNLVGQDLLPGYRLEIGLRLMRHLPPNDLDDKIFCIVSQLKAGLHLLKDQNTKYEVAAIFVKVAEKAAVTSSFDASHIALSTAYELLGPNHWDEAYDLSLVVYNYLAEVEFVVKDNERVDELLDEVFEMANVCSDMVRAYTTKVHVLGARGEAEKAISIGMCILEKLGIKMPSNPSKRNLFWALRKVEKKLKGRSNESLMRSPLMIDEKLLVGMQVLNLIFLNTFHYKVDLFPFVVLKMMKLSLKHGFSAMTSVAVSGYGSLLCFMEREQEAQRFGKLALDLVDQFDAASYRSRVYALHFGCIQPSMRPWKESLDYLKEGHRLGLGSGDTEFGMYNANLHFAFMLDDGSFSVLEVATFLKDTLELTELHGHDHQLMMMKVCSKAFFAFSDPEHDIRDHTAIDAALRDSIQHGNIFSIGMMYCFKAAMYMVTGDMERGIETLDKRRSVCDFVSGSIFESFEQYLDGLFAFGLARRETNSSRRKKLIQRGTKDMKVLQRLAMVNPEACGGKALLLEAEYDSLRKKDMVANKKYSQAIAIGQGHRAHFEVAFANQVAADHSVIDMNDPRTGRAYLEASKDAYENWGAFAFSTVLKEQLQILEEKCRFSIHC
eukprot:CAMPEP_0113485310 /NCGR_PEP_ID=MMETSP0014_2-20120614/24417_1 /TAXON_ID=2857 /ORGANISM="Nitzschia sp." /LENGTH=1205 /DNA_ID=CAMNT_0000378951 /DNA_START=205 /DNA_END=3822 /DNA_ORIENTATION=+ /assembly_acc=CAM_ASM_000159